MHGTKFRRYVVVLNVGASIKIYSEGGIVQADLVDTGLEMDSKNERRFHTSNSEKLSAIVYVAKDPAPKVGLKFLYSGMLDIETAKKTSKKSVGAGEKLKRIKSKKLCNEHWIKWY